MNEPLPAREDQAALQHPATRALAFFGAGVVTAVAVDALSRVEPSFQHVHAAPGIPPGVVLLAALPHEALFALPLIMILIILARETRPSQVLIGLGACIAGLGVTHAWILPP